LKKKLQDLGLHEIIILKFISKKWKGRVQTRFVWITTGTNGWILHSCTLKKFRISWKARHFWLKEELSVSQEELYLLRFMAFSSFLITFHIFVLIIKSNTERYINALSSKCSLLYFNAKYWVLDTKSLPLTIPYSNMSIIYHCILLRHFFHVII
jgi:hypothetical protein